MDEQLSFEGMSIDVSESTLKAFAIEGLEPQEIGTKIRFEGTAVVGKVIGWPDEKRGGIRQQLLEVIGEDFSFTVL